MYLFYLSRQPDSFIKIALVYSYKGVVEILKVFFNMNIFESCKSRKDFQLPRFTLFGKSGSRPFWTHDKFDENSSVQCWYFASGSNALLLSINLIYFRETLIFDRIRGFHIFTEFMWGSYKNNPTLLFINASESTIPKESEFRFPQCFIRC